MICLIKNILTAAFAEVFYKKLFFIASRQYVSHKFYNSAIMRALMILKHHDIKENILKLFHANLKKDSTSHSKNFLYEQEKRDQIMQNVMRQQFMNNDENINFNIIVSSMFIYLNSNLINIKKVKI